MPDELEERLRSHAKSFDSLLSLIPAKLYYGEDVSDQWKRKKQTPEQKRAAKMAKLDPDNWKSAKDVMDERSAAAKRKRDEEEDTQETEPLVEPEKPKVVQDEQYQHSKKRKTDENDTERPTKQPKTAAESAEEKRRRQVEKKVVKKEKRQQQKEKQKAQKSDKKPRTDTAQGHDESWVDVEGEGDDDELAEAMDISQIPDSLIDVEMMDSPSTAPSSDAGSLIMSPPADSASSSISSIPASISDATPNEQKSNPNKKAKSNLSKSNTASDTSIPPPSLDASEKAAARERLSAAIATMRTQRKADSGPRNRRELLDLRRRKEEARRVARKEQRLKEKEEATRKEDEEIERRFSPGGSGSLLGSPRSPPLASDAQGGGNTFSFGRIELGDGTQFDSTNLSGVLEQTKKKGPQDANTALLAAKNKAARLAGLDENKRKQIEEKDMWLNAKRRAHGERVKDDSSLLKKALKRQEGQKRKSEKEWTDRKEGVQKSQEVRQKKRTENLAKRKDEKKSNGGGAKKGKKVKRPGFEGSFRGRTGGKKK